MVAEFFAHPFMINRKHPVAPYVVLLSHGIFCDNTIDGLHITSYDHKLPRKWARYIEKNVECISEDIRVFDWLMEYPHIPMHIH